MRFVGISVSSTPKLDGVLYFFGNQELDLGISTVQSISGAVQKLNSLSLAGAVVAVNSPLILPDSGSREVDKILERELEVYQLLPYNMWNKDSGRLWGTQLRDELGENWPLLSDIRPRYPVRGLIEVHAETARTRIVNLARLAREQGTVDSKPEHIDDYRVAQHVMSLCRSKKWHLAQAIVCAYCAYNWWYWGKERNRVVGTTREGFVIQPIASYVIDIPLKRKTEAELKKSLDILVGLLTFLFIKEKHLYYDQDVQDLYRHLMINVKFYVSQLWGSRISEIEKSFLLNMDALLESEELDIIRHETSFPDALIRRIGRLVLRLKRLSDEFFGQREMAGESSDELRGLAERYETLIQDVRSLDATIGRNDSMSSVPTDNPSSIEETPTECDSPLLTITGKVVGRGASLEVLIKGKSLPLAPRYFAYLLRLVVALRESSDGFVYVSSFADEFHDGELMTYDGGQAAKWKSEVGRLLEGELGPEHGPAIISEYKRQRLSLDWADVEVEPQGADYLSEFIEESSNKDTVRYLKIIGSLLERLLE